MHKGAVEACEGHPPICPLHHVAIRRDEMGYGEGFIVSVD